MDSAEHGAGSEKSRHTNLKTDCEGFIAVTALLVMAILLMIGVAFLSTATTENTMVVNEVDGQAAFNVAEAGIDHAKRALTDLTTVITQTQPIPSLSQVPFGGGYIGTSYTVRITNNCDPAVYSSNHPERCTKLLTPAAPLDTGGPTSDTDNLVVATSTGTYKRCSTCPEVTRVIQALIGRSTPKPKGTLEAHTNVNVQSAAAVIDGRNNDCDGNNPSPDGNLPAATTPTGPAGISINKSGNLLCDAGSGTTCGGTSGTFPDTIAALLLRDSTPPATQSQIDDLNRYLESIKISSAEAATRWTTDHPLTGIGYVDGDYANPPDGSTGILIVHHRDASNHDVAKLGNFNGGTFRGLIIADKIDKINGTAHIYGAIFGFGASDDGVRVDDVDGTPRIKYSKCAIDTYVSQALPSRIVPGTWHEL